MHTWEEKNLHEHLSQVGLKIHLSFVFFIDGCVGGPRTLWVEPSKGRWVLG